LIDCIIVGDSIAVGVSQVRTECKAYVKSGINSTIWNRTYLHNLEPSNTLIISLGANDTRQIDTESNVRLLRNKTKATKVYWLLPSVRLKPRAVEAVRRVAGEFGDIVIERPTTDISGDGVHPTRTGYKKLAESTR
jgi:lysophospholipase L1-like esterase